MEIIFYLIMIVALIFNFIFELIMSLFVMVGLLAMGIVMFIKNLFGVTR